MRLKLVLTRHARASLFLLYLFFTALLGHSQTAKINPAWLHGFWKAKWIAPVGLEGNVFSVSHFRKTIELAVKPASFVIHVSADNRYRLYVNGISVGTGPARSDLANWNFETIDIAPMLHNGHNTIAATVWNFAEYRPYSQISYQTAFIIQGDGPTEEMLNTDNTWKATKDSAYTPFPFDRGRLHTYIVTASGEKLNGNLYDWGFQDEAYDDTRWSNASQLGYGAKSRSFGSDGNWMLVPRTIPTAEETPQRFALVRRVTFSTGNLYAFLAGNSPIQIPAHTSATLLFDQSFLTNAYPLLKVSAGKNSVIRLSYAEALVDKKDNKGNRDSVDGKELVGFSDQFTTDGGNDRVYAPLFFRTFRYLQMDIETAEEPLTIKDFSSIFTGYPFMENAYFKSDVEALGKIWQAGWRTARLCAVDTYFDCPYYEQLQYVGDTRIQAMISIYVSGDDRLMRKAIDDISHSFFADGLTQSRYPSRDMQVIPTFSLWWICMIHDYWMHRKDDAFIKSQMNVMENVLDWYQGKVEPSGMLGPLNWWQFVDWSWPWVDSIRVGGVPPGASKGGSSIISLQYAYTLQRAAQLMSKFGKNELARRYLQEANSIKEKTFQQCWDAQKGLLADDNSKSEFSQHANIMAVLTDAVPVATQQQLMEKVLANKTITQCTYYFKFYLFEALKKANLGNRFLGLLQPWHDMLNIGLTTFAESPEPVRSDCHAWSASPNYELLSLVCGIRPASSGFASVLVAPQPGNLKWIKGKVPHPKGDILLDMDMTKKTAEVTLPDGLKGEFIWQGKTTLLKAGRQIIQW